MRINGRIVLVGRELREHLWCYGELIHAGGSDVGSTIRSVVTATNAAVRR